MKLINYRGFIYLTSNGRIKQGDMVFKKRSTYDTPYVFIADVCTSHYVGNNGEGIMKEYCRKVIMRVPQWLLYILQIFIPYEFH